MGEVIPVRLKGKLKEVVDSLVSAGIYGSKSEVIRSGIRKLGEEHGLLQKDARYHLRMLQSKAKGKSAGEVMDRLEKIGEKVWKKRQRRYA